MGTTTLELRPLPEMPAKDPKVMEFLQAKGVNALSETEQEWFYWTNYSRQYPQKFWDSVLTPLLAVFPPLRNSFSASLKHDLYASPALAMVKPNSNLAKVAAIHAKDLAKHNSLPSHTSPSGATFQERMENANISFCAGENISYGPWGTVLMIALLYIDEGVPDLGHRKSLLTPNFVEMGIGIGKYQDGRTLVVQDFACAQDGDNVSRGTGR